MKDLYRCLDEYPAEMLQAIAEVWQLPAPTSDQREDLVRFAEGLLAAEAIQRVVAGLSEDARLVLAEVQAAGGAVPAPRLALSHGNIRRLGPAGMARIRPWLHPENPLEELYYRGLLHRAYAELSGQTGEIYFVPQQLYEALPALSADTTAVLLASSPPRIQEDGDALVEDMLAVLAHVRQHHVPAPDEDLPRGACPEALARIPWEGRFLGETHALRLGFIWALLRRQRLVQVRGGYLQPSLRARDWLHLSDAQRQAQLWAVWRDDLAWDELRLLPELHVQETVAHNPAMARKRILALLAELPAERWLSVRSFVHLAQARQADLIRSGNSAGWEVREAEGGQVLSGPSSWLLVEGRLLEFVTLTMLRWLGATKAGAEDASSKPFAFWITERGRELLTSPVALAGDAAPARVAAEDQLLAEVRDDLIVTIRTRESAYERYQLERFAEWRAQDEQLATYEITAESVWHSLNAGIKTEQMLAFLRRIRGDSLPVAVTGALRAWAGRFGHAAVRRVAILETVDQRTMEQIAAHQGMAGLLGQAIKPTMRLVDEENVETLIRLLKEAGIWPRVRV